MDNKIRNILNDKLSDNDINIVSVIMDYKDNIEHCEKISKINKQIAEKHKQRSKDIRYIYVYSDKQYISNTLVVEINSNQKILGIDENNETGFESFDFDYVISST
jgi:Leucine-rich repeat (LRR) protein